MTPDERATIEQSLPGGLVAYVNRLRAAHGVTFPRPDVLGVCRCGEPGCAVALLLVHIDELLLAYSLKVDDLARETVRTFLTEGEDTARRTRSEDRAIAALIKEFGLQP